LSPVNLVPEKPTGDKIAGATALYN